MQMKKASQTLHGKETRSERKKGTQDSQAVCSKCDQLGSAVTSSLFFLKNNKFKPSAVSPAAHPCRYISSYALLFSLLFFSLSNVYSSLFAWHTPPDNRGSNRISQILSGPQNAPATCLRNVWYYDDAYRRVSACIGPRWHGHHPAKRRPAWARAARSQQCTYR